MNAPDYVNWCAWAIFHDSHGYSMDTLVFLPDGERPDTEREWRRLPWLDKPRHTEAPTGEP